MARCRVAPSSTVAVAARSDPGRRRSHNEDRVATDSAHGVAVLADGMGGHKGGDVASGLAVETVTREFAERLGGIAHAEGDDETGTSASEIARDIVAQANTIVHETARTQPQYEGMGTTLVVALFHDDRLTLAHVGDSRAYRLRGGHLEQLTHDHTLMQELIDRGFYTPEEAHASLNRNIVTRALGIEESVDVDLQVDIVVPGDVYLLCSDGLNDMMDDETIRLTIEEYGDNLDEAADRLIATANERGGEDNVSVVLVRIIEPVAHHRSWFRRLVDWFR